MWAYLCSIYVNVYNFVQNGENERIKWKIHLSLVALLLCIEESVGSAWFVFHFQFVCYYFVLASSVLFTLFLLYTYDNTSSVSVCSFVSLSLAQQCFFFLHLHSHYCYPTSCCFCTLYFTFTTTTDLLKFRTDFSKYLFKKMIKSDWFKITFKMIYYVFFRSKPLGISSFARKNLVKKL